MNGMATQSMEEFLHSMMSDSPVDERLQASISLDEVTTAQDETERNYEGTRANLDALALERPWIAQFIKEQGEKAYEQFEKPLSRYGMLKASNIAEIYYFVDFDDSVRNKIFNFKRYRRSMLWWVSTSLFTTLLGGACYAFIDAGVSLLSPFALIAFMIVMISGLVTGVGNYEMLKGGFLEDNNFKKILAKKAFKNDDKVSYTSINNELFIALPIEGQMKNFQVAFSKNLEFTFIETTRVKNNEAPINEDNFVFREINSNSNSASDLSNTNENG